MIYLCCYPVVYSAEQFDEAQKNAALVRENSSVSRGNPPQPSIPRTLLGNLLQLTTIKTYR